MGLAGWYRFHSDSTTHKCIFQFGPCINSIVSPACTHGRIFFEFQRIIYPMTHTKPTARHPCPPTAGRHKRPDAILLRRNPITVHHRHSVLVVATQPQQHQTYIQLFFLIIRFGHVGPLQIYDQYKSISMYILCPGVYRSGFNGWLLCH